MSVDYRKLLISYMAGVVSAESVFFDPIDATPEEQAEFEALKPEACRKYEIVYGDGPR
jgi:hypothetical protein